MTSLEILMKITSFSLCVSLKGGFHGRTNINEINHRCIKIGRQVTQTCRHRPMEIGAVLAADFTPYFVIGRPEKWLFG